MNASDRFFAKVQPATDGSGCLLWIGAKTTSKKDMDGYGVFYADGRYIPAHRWLLERAYGIPAGLQVDHLCRVPSCVRPSHLEIVTQAENLRRGRRHANPPTHCKHGHAYTEENVYRWRGRRICRTCLARRTKAWKSSEAGKAYNRDCQRALRAKRRSAA